MRRIKCLVVALGVALCAATAAGAGGRNGVLPPRYVPNSLDGALIELSNPVDGRTLTVWAFHNGTEYDLAVSFIDSNGWWQPPMLVGQGDRRNQVQPALAVDARGTVYLAFVDGPERRLLLSTLPAGGTEWSPATALTAPGARAAKPVLQVVGDRLVVGYMAAGQVRMLDVPLASAAPLPEGVSEGPDPFDRDKQPPDDKSEDPPPSTGDGTTTSPTPKG